MKKRKANQSPPVTLPKLEDLPIDHLILFEHFMNAMIMDLETIQATVEKEFEYAKVKRPGNEGAWLRDIIEQYLLRLEVIRGIIRDKEAEWRSLN